MTARFSTPTAARLTLLPLLLLLLAIPPAVAQDGSFTHPAYTEPGDNETADRSDLGNVAQSARFQYAEGNRHLKRAAKLEKKLASTEADKRADLEAKIAGAYEAAIGKFTEAVRTAPKMMEAYAALGEAYGKVGKHQQRLQVHSAALKVEPGNEANFRGWAAALLELDMLGDATRAWEHFHANDPDKAAILRAEMSGWLERRRAEPGQLAPEDIERLAAWLDERS